MGKVSHGNVPEISSPATFHWIQLHNFRFARHLPESWIVCGENGLQFVSLMVRDRGRDRCDEQRGNDNIKGQPPHQASVRYSGKPILPDVRPPFQRLGPRVNGRVRLIPVSTKDHYWGRDTGSL